MLLHFLSATQRLRGQLLLLEQETQTPRRPVKDAAAKYKPLDRLSDGSRFEKNAGQAC